MRYSHHYESLRAPDRRAGARQSPWYTYRHTTPQSQCSNSPGIDSERSRQHPEALIRLEGLYLLTSPCEPQNSDKRDGELTACIEE